MKDPQRLGTDLLHSWLAGGADAASVDQWIFWNNSPSRHVPLSTLTQFFPESFYHVLSEDLRVRAQVDTLLRSKMSWEEPVSWAPQDPLWEISLVEPKRFQRFAFLAATLSVKEVISKIIDGIMVRKLRQEIGEDIVEFSLLSGSLTKYSFASISGAMPLLDDPVATIQQRGVMLIQNAFSSKERGVQRRIASKLPGCFPEGPAETPSLLAAATQEMLCKLWKETSSWL